MANKKTNSKDSIYKKVIQKNDSSGELSFQFTIDLTEYDTSKIDGFQEGDKVYKGFTCKFATLKLNKENPKARIDIDPSNSEIRNAITEMYEAYDNFLASR